MSPEQTQQLQDQRWHRLGDGKVFMGSQLALYLRKDHRPFLLRMRLGSTISCVQDGLKVKLKRGR